MSEIEVIARGLCLRDGKVLVCRNIKQGYAFLPGGHVEFGEPAAVSLAREMIEEANAAVTVGRCLLISEGAFETKKRPHHEVNIVFHMELASDEPVVSVEPQIAFDWMDPASAVDTDLRPAGIRAWIAAGFGSGQMEWLSEIETRDEDAPAMK